MSTSDVLAAYQAGRTDFTELDIDDPPSGSRPLRGALLSGTDFSKSFIDADFTAANLSDALFRGSNVKTCTFDRADLTGADFRGAAICSATFTDARLSSCKLAGAYIHAVELTETDAEDVRRQGV